MWARGVSRAVEDGTRDSSPSRGGGAAGALPLASDALVTTSADAAGASGVREPLVGASDGRVPLGAGDPVTVLGLGGTEPAARRAPASASRATGSASTDAGTRTDAAGVGSGDSAVQP